MNNPFVIKAYKSRELFCDRQDELQLMLRNSINHTDMTLISQRRIGKTGLILRLFDEIAELYPDIHTIYVDIFSSRNIDDFIKLLAEAIMKAFKPKTTIGEKLMTFIKTMRPQLSFDNITGEPQLTIAYQSPHEKEYTLRGLLDFLDNQDVPIIIAIDEFQQIRDYPEKNMEALLRTYIQQTRNLTFIYCGSKKHLMADIFTNEKKPFFSSTAFVSLGKISAESYTAFIRRLFDEYDREIDDEAISFILDWTRRHTYYTQQLCHTIFANGEHQIGIKQVKDSCEQLMQQGEAIYLQYRQMLTVKQWSYLIAVAKERTVSQITAANFLGRHKIGSASTSQRLADALCEKGLLNDDIKTKGTTYSVNDVFFSHWLERL